MIGRRVSHHRIIEKLGQGGMGVVYKAEDHRLGRRSESVATVEQFLAEDKSKMAMSYWAAVYARSGKKDDSRALLVRLQEALKQEYVSGYLLAQVYFAPGDDSGGWTALEKGFEQRSSDILLIMPFAPQFERIRRESRFLEMWRRHGLPPTPTL